MRARMEWRLVCIAPKLWKESPPLLTSPADSCTSTSNDSVQWKTTGQAPSCAIYDADNNVFHYGNVVERNANMSPLTLTMDANINGFTVCMSRMSPAEMFETLPVSMGAVLPCQNNYGGKCPHCPHYPMLPPPMQDYKYGAAKHK